MAKVFLVDLEAVETRYTGQWKTHLPVLLQQHGLETKYTGPGVFWLSHPPTINQIISGMFKYVYSFLSQSI